MKLHSTGDLWFYDLLCVLSVLIMFYFPFVHVVYCMHLFSFSDFLSKIANLRFGLSPKFSVQVKVFA